MENKVLYVSSNELVEIKKDIENDNSLFIAEIDGNNIQRLQDFLNIMTEVFHFPYPSGSLDSYNDWMRDLDWLDKEGYVLIINNFKGFLSQDLLSKKVIIDGFTNVILPFWQEEVMEVVVEGQVKPFMVYLVD